MPPFFPTDSNSPSTGVAREKAVHLLLPLPNSRRQPERGKHAHMHHSIGWQSTPWQGHPPPFQPALRTWGRQLSYSALLVVPGKGLTTSGWSKKSLKKPHPRRPRTPVTSSDLDPPLQAASATDVCSVWGPVQPLNSMYFSPGSTKVHLQYTLSVGVSDHLEDMELHSLELAHLESLTHLPV